MDHLPEALYRAAEIRVADRRAAGLPGFGNGMLMERAGTSAFHATRERFPRARRWAVVCGPGNNGGDGYVLARHARAAGLDAVVLLPAETTTPAGDARSARERWLAAGGSERIFEPASLARADVVVDALFGTGLERPLDGVWLDVVRAINASARPAVALDLPSGLHADSGRVLGAAVRATVTVSFIGLKAGLFTGEGRTHAGVIVFDDLAVPATVFDGLAPLARRLMATDLRGLLAPRARHAHKGEAGRVLVVGGQPGMAGAARLASEAAYRAGAGLVTLATHPTHAGVVGSTCPELITAGIDTPAGLDGPLERASVLALGPGLGQGEWARRLFERALQSGRAPVVDADALNLLAAHPQVRADWILTPHPGEAARLLGCSVPEVQAYRFAAARAIVQRYGGVCVLKGSGTLIAADAGAPLWLCDRGNPGLASGGSGDVLTGVIAALRAQGLAPVDAARLGVWAHATAGDRAAGAGERGLMAGDLFAPLRTVLHELDSA